jgi:hypothetical protein
MSGSNDRWAELSSQNERVVQQGERAAVPAGSPAETVRARWAELTSQSERLADQGDLEYQLASPRLGGQGMRRVASAA